jgi:hypothetical protein
MTVCERVAVGAARACIDVVHVRDGSQRAREPSVVQRGVWFKSESSWMLVCGFRSEVHAPL